MKRKYSIEDIDEFINDLMAVRKTFREQVIRYMNEASLRTVRETYKEYGDVQRRTIKRVFDDAITQFYDSYNPSLYDRQGSETTHQHGLYDVLDQKAVLDLTSPTIGQDGSVEIGDSGDDDTLRYRLYFNENNMHKGRDRNTGAVADLFDQVFMKGWHGGAASISGSKSGVWGEHPQNGTPYYRTAGFVTYPGSDHPVFHKWGAWKPGGDAARTEAPFSIFCRNMKEAEDTELFKALGEIANRKNSKNMEKVRQKAERLQETLYRGR